MPARTSRVLALALWTVWKFSQEFYTRANFPNSFRAGGTIRAWCGLAELADGSTPARRIYVNLRNLWITFEYANQRNELDDGGRISQARRPRGAAAGLHGATRVSELERGQHFGGTTGCRSGRAVRRSCISRPSLRHHAVFPRVSGNDYSSGGNLHVGGGRHSRCDCRARIQTHPDC